MSRLYPLDRAQFEKKSETITHLQRQIKDLEQQIADCKLAENNLSFRYLEIQKSNKWLKDVEEDLSKQCLDYQEQIKSNKTELNELEQKLKKNEKLWQQKKINIEVFKLTWDSAKKESDAWQATVSERSLHFKKLKTQKIEKHHELKVIQQKITQLQEQLEKLKQDLSRTLEKNQEFKSESEKLFDEKIKSNYLIKDKVNEQKKKIDRLKNGISENQTQTDTNDRTIIDLSTKAGDLQDKLNSQLEVKKESEKLNKKNKYLIKEHKELERQIEELTKKMHKSSQSIGAIISDIPSQALVPKEPSVLVKGTILKSQNTKITRNTQVSLTCSS